MEHISEGSTVWVEDEIDVEEELEELELCNELNATVLTTPESDPEKVCDDDVEVKTELEDELEDVGLRLIIYTPKAIVY